MDNAQKMETRYAKGKYPIYYDEQNDIKKSLETHFKVQDFGPPPATIITNTKGIIKFVYIGDSPEDIPENLALLKALETMD